MTIDDPIADTADQFFAVSNNVKRIGGVPPLLRTESTTRLQQHCSKNWLHFCLSIVKLVGSVIVKFVGPID